MSHFYAQIPHSARKTTPTARGHKSTGINTQAASYAGAIEVDLFHDEETGKDHFVINQMPWQNSGISEKIATGVLGESQ